MDRIELNRLSKLRFVDPRLVLPPLEQLRGVIAAQTDIDPNVRNLRTHELKRMRELWAACIFACGISEFLQANVFVADDETSDYDFVCGWAAGDTSNFCPVQLKEIVPTELNLKSNLQAVIDGIAERKSYKGRSIAIKLTRECLFDPDQLDLSGLDIESLWVFGAISPDQKEWAIWGDLLRSRSGLCFNLPS